MGLLIVGAVYGAVMLFGLSRIAGLAPIRWYER